MLILVVLAWLGAVVTGCDGARRYDSRLVAADSLMRDHPDSALALVEAVGRDSLADEGDRAYRDLLLTQARYRCYVTATSDSAINRALAWFSAHPSEREKLTRALIYKGAVMDELHHPDSAMLYYKQAEATANEEDYHNLGQINLRIAALYRLYYADRQICLDKYQKALRYFIKTGNYPQQQICLYNIGVCLSTSAPDSCKRYLSQACAMAINLNDSARIYKCKEFLCRLCITDTDSNSLQEAKLLAQECLHHYSNYIDKSLVFDLASIYVRLEMPDSSRYFLSMLKDNAASLSAQDEVYYYRILAELSRNEGDSAKYNYYLGLQNQVSDSIDDNLEQSQIQRIENHGNQNQLIGKNDKIKGQRKMIYFLCLILIISAVSVVYSCLRTNKAKAIIRELKNSQYNYHEELLQQLDVKELLIEDFVRKLVTLMHVSIDASEKDPPRIIQRRIRESIDSIINDEFWDELRNYLDRKYNNMITDLAKNPRLKKKDLHFIELICCGFSHIEIAITMNYSPKYVYQKRDLIASKLSIDVPLQVYLDSLMGK